LGDKTNGVYARYGFVSIAQRSHGLGKYTGQIHDRHMP